MEKSEKNNIKAKAYKQALQNFEISFVEFLNEPTFGNYLECKIAKNAFLSCQKNLNPSKQVNEILQGINKNKFRCVNFKEIPYFEEMIKIREEREIASTKLINYLQNYEKNAKKEGKKIKHNYSHLLIDVVDHLDEIELATTVGRKFPKESYIKLPAPSNLRLTDLAKLKEYYIEFNTQL
jgi:hypothetical protein